MHLAQWIQWPVSLCMLAGTSDLQSSAPRGMPTLCLECLPLLSHLDARVLAEAHDTAGVAVGAPCPHGTHLCQHAGVAVACRAASAEKCWMCS